MPRRNNRLTETIPPLDFTAILADEPVPAPAPIETPAHSDS